MSNLLVSWLDTLIMPHCVHNNECGRKKIAMNQQEDTTAKTDAKGQQMTEKHWSVTAVAINTTHAGHLMAVWPIRWHAYAVRSKCVLSVFCANFVISFLITFLKNKIPFLYGKKIIYYNSDKTSIFLVFV